MREPHGPRTGSMRPVFSGTRRTNAWSVLWAAATALCAIMGCSNKPSSGGAAGLSSAESETVSVSPSPGAEEKKLASGPVSTVWRSRPDFSPPFPQRHDLFVPPDKVVAVKTARQVGSAQVALKGFAEFGDRRVVLEINGSIVCLREGEQRHGILVVAVSPPQVTLQYEGRQWTENLLRTKPVIAHRSAT